MVEANALQLAPVIFDPDFFDEAYAATVARSLLMTQFDGVGELELWEPMYRELDIFGRENAPLRPALVGVWCAITQAGETLPSLWDCHRDLYGVSTVQSVGAMVCGTTTPPARFYDQQALVALTEGLDVTAMPRVWRAWRERNLFTALATIMVAPTPRGRAIHTDIRESLVAGCVDAYVDNVVDSVLETTTRL